MKQYESYKESGIEWLGQIPSHWNIVHIKNFFQVISGATPDSSNTNYWDGDIKWITPADFKTSDHFVSTGKRNITEEGYNSCGTSLVPAGSLIFSKRAPIGTVAISSNVLCTNQGCLSCVPFEKICYSPYYYYLFSVLTEAFEMLGSGSTFLEISANNFSNFPISAPPFKEQQTIAAYLDYKVSQIDAAITEKEQMLEDLKAYRSSIISETVTKGLDKNVEMKDSGIDWIGKIPQNWDVVRIKNILDYNSDSLKVGPFGSSLSGNDFKTEGYWVYNQRVVLDNNFDTNDTFISEEKYNELNSFQVFAGDILLTTRGTIGKVAIVPNRFYKGVLHPCLIRFRVNDSMVNKDFIKYYFNDTSLILDQVKYNSNSTTIDVIYSYTLKDLIVTLPPLRVQNEIVAHINKKVQNIDEILKNTSSSLLDLKAYRSSLITEAVTGKVDLRDWKLNKQ